MPKKLISQENEHSVNIFKSLWNKYVPYWPLFLLLLMGFGLAGFLFMHYAIPKFDITAKILVKDEKNGVDDQNLMDQLDLFGSKKLVENEIEVLKSYTLARNVALKLKLYAPVNYEGKLISRSGYIYSPVLIEAKVPDSLEESKDPISFIYDSAKKAVTINQKSYGLNVWISDSSRVYRFVPNPNYRRPEKVKPLSFSFVPLQKILDDLADDIKVTQATKLSSVINLEYSDAIPKRGKDILNGLINEYNDAALADKNVLAANTLDFVNERLAVVSGELDTVEQGIQQYKTKEGIVDLSAQGEQYLETSSLNDQNLSQINVQIAVLDQVNKYVKTDNPDQAIVPSTFGITDPVLAGLLQNYYSLQTQLEGLKKNTAENNPLLMSVVDQIAQLKPSILQNIRTQRQNLDASQKNLASNSDRFSKMLLSIPKKERALVKISREQMVKNTIYGFLLQKREETALSYKSAIADTRILDRAISSFKPAWPKGIVIYLIAGLLAFITGAGFIGAKELLNTRVLYRSEIEDATATPIIAEISEVAKDQPEFVQEGLKNNLSSEEFRQLRTSLSYLGINTRKKKILITSSIGGEGKSFITANLGLSLAFTNKKVVMLEFDLRKPKLSRMFGISRDTGLSNYLVGNKDAEDIIKPTAQSPNLFVIPSGATPPNPSELILNGRLDELLAYLETTFDYILIDTAPTGPVTDAYILSPFCDATLYIIRHAVTPKHNVEILDQNMKVKGLKNLAIVFNGLKERMFSKSGYGYTNQKSYGYFREEEKGFFKKIFSSRSNSKSRV